MATCSSASRTMRAGASRDLGGRLAGAVGPALFAAPPPSASSPGAEAPAADLPAEARPLLASPGTPGRVRTGLDVVAAQNFAMFAGHSVGLITNQTGVDAQGRRAIDLFADAPGVRLQAIFSPEHGLGGDATTDVPHGRDPATGRPIWSLYGPARRPSREMLKDVSLLVFDIQDVGVRYYPYLPPLVYGMEGAGRAGSPRGRRTLWGGGGGTPPLEVVGAPWTEPRGLGDALNRLGLRGLRFEPVWFTPMADQYAQIQCGGVRLVVTDRDTLRPVTVALALARELRVRHRDQFRPESIQNLLVNRSTMWAFLSGESFDRLVSLGDTDPHNLLNRRASYLMYR